MSRDHFAVPICRHLKTNGLRCQSPALNGEPFCYFHVRLHTEHPVPLTAREIVNLRNSHYAGYEEALIGAGEDPMQIARAYPEQNEIKFPPLEHAESIQLAASMLFHAIAQGQVHLRRARLLRDMLRVATVSCRMSKPNPDLTTTTVRQIDHTPEGVAIAPADQPSDAVPEHLGAVPETAALAPADPAPESENSDVPSEPARIPIPTATPPSRLTRVRKLHGIKILPVSRYRPIFCRNSPP